MEHYIVIKEVGRGSFGRAFKAICRSTNTSVVLKQIDTAGLTPKQYSEALNEVRVLRSLTHPNIVRHLDNFRHQGYICIVMEFANGGDLESRIRSISLSRSHLNEDQIAIWFIQILQGLSFLHSRNIMHRDLKPQNIFIADNGSRVMIGDFGVCKVLQSKADLASTIAGTPYYLSPEIFQGKPYSFKSDIWSLGCILYQLTALRVPYDAADVKSLSAKVTRGSNPPFPTMYSKDLRNIFYETMQRDHRSRPSAHELLSREYIKSHSMVRVKTPCMIGRVRSCSPNRTGQRSSSPQSRVPMVARSVSPAPQTRRGLPPRYPDRVVATWYTRSQSPSPCTFRYNTHENIQGNKTPLGGRDVLRRVISPLRRRIVNTPETHHPRPVLSHWS